MTTAVGLALTKALDAVPGKGWNLDQKIHHYLKDHPNKTNEEIAKALGSNSHSTYVCLNRALKAGLLRRRKGSRFTKGVWEYEVVFKEFQQPPYHNSKKKQPKLADSPEITHVAEAAQPKTSKFDIDSLTLGEARNLYNELHKMFGGGK